MIQVVVVPTVDEVISEDLYNKTVIVIDVLRATSTIVTAFEHKCTEVIPVETVGQAKNLSSPDHFLGGERFCKKITGFHFGNSPLEYTTNEIKGSKIILTTTNGTRAIHKASRGNKILIGSLLNATSCAETAISLRKDIVIICSGTRSEFALEDGLTAGAIIEMMANQGATIQSNDFGEAMRATYLFYGHDLTIPLSRSASGKRLIQIGLAEDILFCARLNAYHFTPYVMDNKVII
ncbi:MAG: 2-phosphosulfolactate phosphatase [Bacilli bacterium]